MHTNRTIKDGMGWSMVNRADTVKQYNKYKNKWKKNLKALKKQNKILYSIAKKSGSRREINKINKIREKVLRRVSTLVAVLPVMIWTPIL